MFSRREYFKSQMSAFGIALQGTGTGTETDEHYAPIFPVGTPVDESNYYAVLNGASGDDLGFKKGFHIQGASQPCSFVNIEFKNWSGGALYIQGVSQLVTVPYCRFSGNGETEL
jgi:hypothetical protein